MGWVGLKRMILRHRGSVLRRSFLTGVFFSERQDRRKNFKPDKKKWNAKVFAFFLQLNVKLKPSALSVPHCLFRLAARMENRLGQTETGDFHGKVRTWKDWQIESSSDFALHFPQACSCCYLSCVTNGSILPIGIQDHKKHKMHTRVLGQAHRNAYNAPY